MKNKELSNKLEALVSKTPSKWVEESNLRLKNKERLHYSQQVAVRILRTLREKKLTQKDLADLLEVSPQTVNKWARGSENFTFYTIVRIEKALDIKLMQIYETKNNVIISATNIININNFFHTFLIDIEKSIVAKKETKVIPLNSYINEEECLALSYNNS